MHPTCRECGQPMEPSKAPGKPKTFCTIQCRRHWHNRRMIRGGELYDFLMAWRFERDRPDMLAQLARLASAYRDADRKLREGRESWNAEEAQQRLPLVFGTDGDRR